MRSRIVRGRNLAATSRCPWSILDLIMVQARGESRALPLDGGFGRFDLFAAPSRNDRSLRIPLKKPSSIRCDGKLPVSEGGWRGSLGGSSAALAGAMRPALPEACSSVLSERVVSGFGQ